MRCSAGATPTARPTRCSRKGAAVYVGDTPNDVRAAARAGAHMVAVTTGPHPAAELRDAGATTVLDSLVQFPAVACGARRVSAATTATTTPGPEQHHDRQHDEHDRDDHEQDHACRVEHRRRRVDRRRLPALAIHRRRTAGQLDLHRDARTPRGGRRAASGRPRSRRPAGSSSDGDDVRVGGEPGLQVLRGRACRSPNRSSRTCPRSRVTETSRSGPRVAVELPQDRRRPRPVRERLRERDLRGTVGCARPRAATVQPASARSPRRTRSSSLPPPDLRRLHRVGVEHRGDGDHAAAVVVHRRP